MAIKHNSLITLGDISTLKGGWEASPDQMLTDFKNAQGRQDHTTPYKTGHPM